MGSSIMNAIEKMLASVADVVGYTVEGTVDSLVAQPGDRAGGLVILNERGGSSLWNPLTDDGDALRLAAIMGATIKTFCIPPYIKDLPYVSVRISYWDSDFPAEIECREEYSSDQMRAIRVAIVNVAVNLFKQRSGMRTEI